MRSYAVDTEYTAAWMRGNSIDWGPSAVTYKNSKHPTQRERGHQLTSTLGQLEPSNQQSQASKHAVWHLRYAVCI